MKPYVERHTNDATDAEAICEAVQRPNMRFVPVKSTEQQAGLMLHRTRHLLVRHKTAASSSIRAFLAELGIVAPIGRNGLDELLRLISEGKDARIPPLARTRLVTLSIQLFALREHIAILDRRLLGWRRTNEMAKRLSKFPGVGPALATALVASVADPKVFRSGRDFSAWIGLVPKQNSSGGKERLGNITKAGDRYLRSLFTAGALSVVKYAKIHGTTHRPWLAKLLERRPVRVAAVALANKLARMASAMRATGAPYRKPVASSITRRARWSGIRWRRTASASTQSWSGSLANCTDLPCPSWSALPSGAPSAPTRFPMRSGSCVRRDGRRVSLSTSR